MTYQVRLQRAEITQRRYRLRIQAQIPDWLRDTRAAMLQMLQTERFATREEAEQAAENFNLLVTGEKLLIEECS